jgi:glycosyltransferase involved in cell wall biosynthesis
VTELAIIVTARNEADRIGATLEALHAAFPDAVVWVADDASEDATAHVALQHGAQLVQATRQLGKGGTATLAAEAILRTGDPVVLLADADLGESAAQLTLLVEGLGAGPADGADLTIAAFARKVGGGFGLAVGSARRAIHSATGRTMSAPISGQRAMRPGVLGQLLPFADGFGMETGMTIDAIRAGLRVEEVELDLEHRATGKTLRGFAHRARQAKDIARAYASRRT